MKRLRTFLLLATLVGILGGLALLLWTHSEEMPHPLMVAEASDLHGKATVIASSHAILRTRGSAVDAEIPLPPPGQAIVRAVGVPVVGVLSAFNAVVSAVGGGAAGGSAEPGPVSARGRQPVEASRVNTCASASVSASTATYPPASASSAIRLPLPDCATRAR